MPLSRSARHELQLDLLKTVLSYISMLIGDMCNHSHIYDQIITVDMVCFINSQLADARCIHYIEYQNLISGFQSAGLILRICGFADGGAIPNKKRRQG